MSEESRLRRNNRVGIDIGGTFTDAVLVDEQGRITTSKVATTPENYAVGFANALRTAITAGGIRTGDLSYIAHGSTVATNALVERAVGRVGLITTAGFRDVLEIGTQQRAALYDLQTPKLAPLVPRDLRLEVRERIGPRGDILRPLEIVDVVDVARTFQREGVEAIAVCLLFSFANPAHECEIARILDEYLPGVPVSLSSRVTPEIREFPRTSTTVVNAALLPVVGGYLRALHDHLHSEGSDLTPYIMRSNGGVATSHSAAELPVSLIASGPAAGVAGAARIGLACGAPNLLTFDMGGTTADVSLVLDGEPQRRYRGSANGHPVNLAQIDVLSIGAGGGSIAAVDSFGALHVGPESAGSQPGPAGYGRGGEQATLTDAHIALGTMDTTRFLGGRMPLDAAAARDAIQRHVATPLGVSLREAALAVIRVANATMAQGLRLVSIERGYDPRLLTLFAFGGAGPMHAAALAEQLGMSRVIVPRYPGVTSALGLLMSDFRHDVGRTWRYEIGEVDASQLSLLLSELETEGRAVLADAGFEESETEIAFEADMRYCGQAYELTVPLQAGAYIAELQEDAEASFRAAHERAYGHSSPTTGIEFTAIRLQATGKVQELPPPSIVAVNQGVRQARTRAFTTGTQPRYEIFDRDEVEGRVVGPALMVQEDATVIVPPTWTLAIDDQDVSVLERVAS
jgi:N-methylhydantoinase A